MHRVMAVSLLVLAGIAIGACSSSDPTAPDGANVRILLTDAPLDLSTVSAVNVTLSSFLLYPAGGQSEGSGIIMSTPGAESRTLNLLDYQHGAVTLVASAAVPPGDYNRIRMIVSAAELVHDDDGDPDTPEAVDEISIPSGKVDIPVPFTLTSGEALEITLDFDAERSVKVNETQGKRRFILRPVVTPVGMAP